MDSKWKITLPLAAAAGFGAALYGTYAYTFYSPHAGQNDERKLFLPLDDRDQYRRSMALIDKMLSRAYEPVSVRSCDGLQLAGRYYHTKDGAPLAILFHGYRGMPCRDFCGGADICFRRGFNVLLIEERAHGNSQGHTITFGVKERYDVLSWVEYAVERFGDGLQILLGGISMGGGTVLMASELALPKNVRGILADCPFSSPAAILRQVIEARGWPVRLAYPLTALSAAVFGGFSLNGADAAEAVKHTRVPILLIHGEADGLVPCEMSRRIAAANPAMVELHTFPGADHGLSYLADTPRYIRLVEDFCERCFQTGKEPG